MHPTKFVELLIASGADPTLRNNEGQSALDVAQQQAGVVAETYYPPRLLAPKRLSQVIEMLKVWTPPRR